MSVLNYILWNPNPVIADLGFLAPRWYGLLFASGFLFGYLIMKRALMKEGLTDSQVEKLTIYMAVGTIVGARLGHCFFYDWDYYLTAEHFHEILFVWQGGLASHGAAIGIILSLYIYSKRVSKRKVLWILDRIVIVVALAGLFIRMGNLVNQEIIGKPADLPWSFQFQAVDQHPRSRAENWKGNFTAKWEDEAVKIEMAALDARFAGTFDLARSYDTDSVKSWTKIGQVALDRNGRMSQFLDRPERHTSIHYSLMRNNQVSGDVEVWGSIVLQGRHPSQLYEGLSYFLIFLLLLFIYRRKREETPYGLLFGLFLILVFTARFLIEYTKEFQVAWEEYLPFHMNMGQILSIPFILAGIFFLVLSLSGRMPIEPPPPPPPEKVTKKDKK